MNDAHLPVPADQPEPEFAVVGALLAWICAVLASSFALVVAIPVFEAVAHGHFDRGSAGMLVAAIPATLFVALFVALFTILPWPVLVWTQKCLRWQRGFSDVILGALMGGGLIELMSNPAGSGAWAVTLAFALAGAVGGLTYWLVAGRPR